MKKRLINIGIEFSKNQLKIQLIGQLSKISLY